jgi:DNA polymerase-1
VSPIDAFCTLIEKPEDLPRLPDNIHTLYLDVETMSGNPGRGALLPYMGDRICGVAFTFDSTSMSWYLPLRHKPSDELFDKEVVNLPLDSAGSFLQELLDRSDFWVNHNIKFDAHFLHVEGLQITSTMIDTLTLATLVDMQAKEFGYGLKPLARDWCGQSTDEQDIIKKELLRRKTKDFGDIPAFILGPYACKDVQINRELWREIQRRRYEDIKDVWNIEVNLTRSLFHIEQRGLKVDSEALESSREVSLSQIATIESQMDGLGFGEVNPSSPAALTEFVINRMGLPVVGVTGSGRPSMNSEAINGYLELPEVLECDKFTEFFNLLEKHRERSQFIALYAEGWLGHIDNNEMLHPMYRQTVATGRMACAQPNMQQLNKEAKQFIVPAAGNAFLSLDYSQIEYRVIASLTQDERILNAYRDNPDTDFHKYIAGLCGIGRKPAKSVNFGIAFGMGERKLTRALAKELGREEAEHEAASILRTYHNRFPRIKQVADLAMRRAMARGWIKTMYGRRRALDKDRSHKAFNTAVQGTAADIAKEQLVAVDCDELLSNAGVSVRAVVHDEFLLEGPRDAIACPEIVEHIQNLMTSPSIELGVPLLVKGGTSEISWEDA